jgi:hypothetical protein
MHWITSLALLFAVYASGGLLYTLWNSSSEELLSATVGWLVILVVALAVAIFNAKRGRGKTS